MKDWVLRRGVVSLVNSSPVGNRIKAYIFYAKTYKMTFNFIKNGKPTGYDRGEWLVAVAKKPRFIDSSYRKRKWQRELINEASERQAKHPDIAKVEKAVKYFQEKKGKGRHYVDLNIFCKMESLYQYNWLLNGSLGTGNKEVMTNHPKIANCDY